MKLRSGIVPLAVFTAIGIVLWCGLRMHPELIPSPLIGKPAPAFSLPIINAAHRTATEKDFLGHVTLFNVWASWCSACAEEHAVWLTIAKENPALVIFGLDYKDDVTAARRILREQGNPYKIVAVDVTGDTAINYGVYGTPETFVIDKKGIIRFKFIGSLTTSAWQETIAPLVATLQGEAG